MNPLVSIGVPIYNVESYIERCARSLFEQTYVHIEYIFIDDNSPDDSIGILKATLEDYPARMQQVKIVRQPVNVGSSAVRNKAVSMMSGEFVMWVDSDDFVELDMVEKLVSAQRQNDADIVTCNTIVHLPKGKFSTMFSPIYNTPKEMTLQLLRKKVPVSVWSRLIRLCLYIDNDVQSLEGINNAEDYQQMPRLTFYAQKVCSINDALYHYNCTNNNSYTATYSPKLAEQVMISVNLLEQFFQDKGIEYVDALNFSKAEIYARDLVKCCRLRYKEYYYLTRGMVEKMDRKYFVSLPLPFRILLKLPDYYIAVIYVKLASIFKKQ